jgi:hypothetical protein
MGWEFTDSQYGSKVSGVCHGLFVHTDYATFGLPSRKYC